ncbi:MAG: hypothetical protein LUQ45_03760 [Methanoregulaceae archaeon]|nr:hypothetical protein [Methanoregulaceae archaeon]
MDEVEAGFSKLMEKIATLDEKKGTLSREIQEREGMLLGRMAKSSMVVVEKIGLNLLHQGKQDTKGEVYDAEFYPKKMIVLGKTDPLEFRPDDMSKKVADQFCVLADDGQFYELMYSSDGFLVDSFLNPLDPDAALQLYGFDVMVMLYRAMRDYLEDQESLVDALQKTLDFIAPGPQGTSP